MIVATNNKGKIKEIKEILTEYDLFSLNEKNVNIDVREDGETFLENAKKKAIEIYNLTKEATIADDSGLCIDALNGFPGVNTHRFLGEKAIDKDRNEYLIKEVDKYDNRSAKVICVMVYYDGIHLISSQGELKGFISKERRGNNGFGFDEIFEISNGLTLAELSSEEKNNVSARFLALQDLKIKLKSIIIK